MITQLIHYFFNQNKTRFLVGTILCVLWGNSIIAQNQPVKYQYLTTTNFVMTKEKVIEKVIQPAIYKTVFDTVLVKPSSMELIPPLPPIYETVKELIKVSKASTKWVKRLSAFPNCCLTANPNDCQIWVLVEVPARYELIEKQVMIKRYYSQKTIAIPMEYEIIKKQILVSPPVIKTIIIPSEVISITRRFVVPENYKEKDIDAAKRNFFPD